jgi:hypothetical protein
VNWLLRGTSHLSAPYRIYSGVKGFDAWHYGKISFCLGKQIATVAQAKEICEKHKAEQPA